MTKICGIYKITNLVNGKVYIGSAVNIERRWKYHKNRLKNYKHYNDHLQKSVNKYGIDNFKFGIEEECLEILLIEKEDFYINKYDSINRNKGYNKCSADRYTITEEVRKKLIIAASRKRRPMTEETKQKISAKNSGENCYNARLNWDKIKEIRKLWVTKKYSQQQLSKYFNVGQENIGCIINNESWKDENYIVINLNHREKLNKEQINEIREKWKTGKCTHKQLAKEFNISRRTINDIVNYRTWKIT